MLIGSYQHISLQEMSMLLTIPFGMVLHIGCQVKERPKPAIASNPRPGSYYFGRGCGLEQNTCHPGRGWVLHVSVYCWLFIFYYDCCIGRVSMHACCYRRGLVSGMNSFRITNGNSSAARMVFVQVGSCRVILTDFIPFGSVGYIYVWRWFPSVLGTNGS